MKKLALGLFFSLSLWGQINYVAAKTTALSATAEVITIQQPATASRIVDFKSAYVDCTVACTVTLERNGTAATSTALTPNPVNPNEGASLATGWSASNVGTGTVLGVYAIGAGGWLSFDLTGMGLLANNLTSQNFTIRTSAITGTVHIAIKFTER